MTDKEIIIDMRKCEHFGIRTSNGKQFGWCHYYDEHCKDYPNCCFKQLKRKEQECEELKDKNQYLINTYCHFKNEIKKYKKAVHKYKVVFQDKIKRLHLSRREFLKEINSVPVKIACDIENFKNALNNFNNAIQVINNEDNYKQALDEIENYVRDNSDFDKSDKLTSNTGAYDILDIINKAKEQ